LTIGNLINKKHRNNNNNNITVGNLLNKNRLTGNNLNNALNNLGQLNTLNRNNNNHNQRKLKPFPGMNERNANQYRNHIKQILGGITNTKVNKKTKSTNFASIINRMGNNKRKKTQKLPSNILLGNIINSNKPQENSYSQAQQSYHKTNVTNGKKTQKGVSVFTNTRLPYNIVYEMKNNKMTKKLVHKKHMLNKS